MTSYPRFFGEFRVGSLELLPHHTQLIEAIQASIEDTDADLAATNERAEISWREAHISLKRDLILHERRKARKRRVSAAMEKLRQRKMDVANLQQQQHAAAAAAFRTPPQHFSSPSFNAASPSPSFLSGGGGAYHNNQNSNSMMHRNNNSNNNNRSLHTPNDTASSGGLGLGIGLSPSSIAAGQNSQQHRHERQPSVAYSDIRDHPLVAEGEAREQLRKMEWDDGHTHNAHAQAVARRLQEEKQRQRKQREEEREQQQQRRFKEGTSRRLSPPQHSQASTANGVTFVPLGIDAAERAPPFLSSSSSSSFNDSDDDGDRKGGVAEVTGTNHTSNVLSFSTTTMRSSSGAAMSSGGGLLSGGIGERRGSKQQLFFGGDSLSRTGGSFVIVSPTEKGEEDEDSSSTTATTTSSDDENDGEEENDKTRKKKKGLKLDKEKAQRLLDALYDDGVSELSNTVTTNTTTFANNFGRTSSRTPPASPTRPPTSSTAADFAAGGVRTKTAAAAAVSPKTPQTDNNHNNVLFQSSLHGSVNKPNRPLTAREQQALVDAAIASTSASVSAVVATALSAPPPAAASTNAASSSPTTNPNNGIGIRRRDNAARNDGQSNTANNGTKFISANSFSPSPSPSPSKDVVVNHASSSPPAAPPQAAPSAPPLSSSSLLTPPIQKLVGATSQQTKTAANGSSFSSTAAGGGTTAAIDIDQAKKTALLRMKYDNSNPFLRANQIMNATKTTTSSKSTTMRLATVIDGVRMPPHYAASSFGGPHQHVGGQQQQRQRGVLLSERASSTHECNFPPPTSGGSLFSDDYLAHDDDEDDAIDDFSRNTKNITTTTNPNPATAVSFSPPRPKPIVIRNRNPFQRYTFGGGGGPNPNLPPVHPKTLESLRAASSANGGRASSANRNNKNNADDIGNLDDLYSVGTNEDELESIPSDNDDDGSQQQRHQPPAAATGPLMSPPLPLQHQQQQGKQNAATAAPNVTVPNSAATVPAMAPLPTKPAVGVVAMTQKSTAATPPAATTVVAVSQQTAKVVQAAGAERQPAAQQPAQQLQVQKRPQQQRQPLLFTSSMSMSSSTAAGARDVSSKSVPLQIPQQPSVVSSATTVAKTAPAVVTASASSLPAATQLTERIEPLPTPTQIVTSTTTTTTTVQQRTAANIAEEQKKKPLPPTDPRAGATLKIETANITERQSSASTTATTTPLDWNSRARRATLPLTFEGMGEEQQSEEVEPRNDDYDEHRSQSSLGSSIQSVETSNTDENDGRDDQPRTATREKGAAAAASTALPSFSVSASSPLASLPIQITMAQSMTASNTVTVTTTTPHSAARPKQQQLSSPPPLPHSQPVAASTALNSSILSIANRRTLQEQQRSGSIPRGSGLAIVEEQKDEQSQSQQQTATPQRRQHPPGLESLTSLPSTPPPHRRRRSSAAFDGDSDTFNNASLSHSSAAAAVNNDAKNGNGKDGGLSSTTILSRAQRNQMRAHLASSAAAAPLTSSSSPSQPLPPSSATPRQSASTSCNLLSAENEFAGVDELMRESVSSSTTPSRANRAKGRTYALSAEAKMLSKAATQRRDSSNSTVAPPPNSISRHPPAADSSFPEERVRGGKMSSLVTEAEQRRRQQMEAATRQQQQRGNGGGGGSSRSLGSGGEATSSVGTTPSHYRVASSATPKTSTRRSRIDRGGGDGKAYCPNANTQQTAPFATNTTNTTIFAGGGEGATNAAKITHRVHQRRSRTADPVPYSASSAGGGGSGGPFAGFEWSTNVKDDAHFRTIHSSLPHTTTTSAANHNQHHHQTISPSFTPATTATTTTNGVFSATLRDEEEVESSFFGSSSSSSTSSSWSSSLSNEDDDDGVSSNNANETDEEGGDILIDTSDLPPPPPPITSRALILSLTVTLVFADAELGGGAVQTEETYFLIQRDDIRKMIEKYKLAKTEEDAIWDRADMPEEEDLLQKQYALLSRADEVPPLFAMRLAQQQVEEEKRWRAENDPTRRFRYFSDIEGLAGDKLVNVEVNESFLVALPDLFKDSSSSSSNSSQHRAAADRVRVSIDAAVFNVPSRMPIDVQTHIEEQRRIVTEQRRQMKRNGKGNAQNVNPAELERIKRLYRLYRDNSSKTKRKDRKRKKTAAAAEERERERDRARIASLEAIHKFIDAAAEASAAVSENLSTQLSMNADDENPLMARTTNSRNSGQIKKHVLINEVVSHLDTRPARTAPLRSTVITTSVTVEKRRSYRRRVFLPHVPRSSIAPHPTLSSPTEDSDPSAQTSDFLHFFARSSSATANTKNKKSAPNDTPTKYGNHHHHRHHQLSTHRVRYIRDPQRPDKVSVRTSRDSVGFDHTRHDNLADLAMLLGAQQHSEVRRQRKMEKAALKKQQLKAAGRRQANNDHDDTVGSIMNVNSLSIAAQMKLDQQRREFVQKMDASVADNLQQLQTSLRACRVLRHLVGDTMEDNQVRVRVLSLATREGLDDEEEASSDADNADAKQKDHNASSNNNMSKHTNGCSSFLFRRCVGRSTTLIPVTTVHAHTVTDAHTVTEHSEDGDRREVLRVGTAGDRGAALYDRTEGGGGDDRNSNTNNKRSSESPNAKKRSASVENKMSERDETHQQPQHWRKTTVTTTTTSVTTATKTTVQQPLNTILRGNTAHITFRIATARVSLSALMKSGGDDDASKNNAKKKKGTSKGKEEDRDAEGQPPVDTAEITSVPVVVNLKPKLSKGFKLLTNAHRRQMLESLEEKECADDNNRKDDDDEDETSDISGSMKSSPSSLFLSSPSTSSSSPFYNGRNPHAYKRRCLLDINEGQCDKAGTVLLHFVPSTVLQPQRLDSTEASRNGTAESSSFKERVGVDGTNTSVNAHDGNVVDGNEPSVICQGELFAAIELVTQKTVKQSNSNGSSNGKNRYNSQQHEQTSSSASSSSSVLTTDALISLSYTALAHTAAVLALVDVMHLAHWTRPRINVTLLLLLYVLYQLLFGGFAACGGGGGGVEDTPLLKMTATAPNVPHAMAADGENHTTIAHVSDDSVEDDGEGEEFVLDLNATLPTTTAAKWGRLPKASAADDNENVREEEDTVGADESLREDEAFANEESANDTREPKTNASAVKGDDGSSSSSSSSAPHPIIFHSIQAIVSGFTFTTNALLWLRNTMTSSAVVVLLEVFAYLAVLLVLARYFASRWRYASHLHALGRRTVAARLLGEQRRIFEQIVGGVGANGANGGGGGGYNIKFDYLTGTMGSISVRRRSRKSEKGYSPLRQATDEATERGAFSPQRKKKLSPSKKQSRRHYADVGGSSSSSSDDDDDDNQDGNRDTTNANNINRASNGSLFTADRTPLGSGGGDGNEAANNNEKKSDDKTQQQQKQHVFFTTGEFMPTRHTSCSAIALHHPMDRLYMSTFAAMTSVPMLHLITPAAAASTAKTAAGSRDGGGDNDASSNPEPTFLLDTERYHQHFNLFRYAAAIEASARRYLTLITLVGVAVDTQSPVMTTVGDTTRPGAVVARQELTLLTLMLASPPRRFLRRAGLFFVIYAVSLCGGQWVLWQLEGCRVGLQGVRDGVEALRGASSSSSSTSTTQSSASLSRSALFGAFFIEEAVRGQRQKRDGEVTDFSFDSIRTQYAEYLSRMTQQQQEQRNKGNFAATTNSAAVADRGEMAVSDEDEQEQQVSSSPPFGFEEGIKRLLVDSPLTPDEIAAIIEEENEGDADADGDDGESNLKSPQVDAKMSPPPPEAREKQSPSSSSSLFQRSAVLQDSAILQKQLMPFTPLLLRCPAIVLPLAGFVVDSLAFGALIVVECVAAFVDVIPHFTYHKTAVAGMTNTEGDVAMEEHLPSSTFNNDEALREQLFSSSLSSSPPSRSSALYSYNYAYGVPVAIPFWDLIIACAMASLFFLLIYYPIMRRYYTLRYYYRSAKRGFAAERTALAADERRRVEKARRLVKDRKREDAALVERERAEREALKKELAQKRLLTFDPQLFSGSDTPEGVKRSQAAPSKGVEAPPNSQQGAAKRREGAPAADANDDDAADNNNDDVGDATINFLTNSFASMAKSIRGRFTSADPIANAEKMLAAIKTEREKEIVVRYALKRSKLASKRKAEDHAMRLWAKANGRRQTVLFFKDLSMRFNVIFRWGVLLRYYQASRLHPLGLLSTVHESLKNFLFYPYASSSAVAMFGAIDSAVPVVASRQLYHRHPLLKFVYRVVLAPLLGFDDEGDNDSADDNNVLPIDADDADESTDALLMMAAAARRRRSSTAAQRKKALASEDSGLAAGVLRMLRLPFWFVGRSSSSDDVDSLRRKRQSSSSNSTTKGKDARSNFANSLLLALGGLCGAGRSNNMWTTPFGCSTSTSSFFVHPSSFPASFPLSLKRKGLGESNKRGEKKSRGREKRHDSLGHITSAASSCSSALSFLCKLFLVPFASDASLLPMEVRKGGRTNVAEVDMQTALMARKRLQYSQYKAILAHEYQLIDALSPLSSSSNSARGGIRSTDEDDDPSQPSPLSVVDVVQKLVGNVLSSCRQRKKHGHRQSDHCRIGSAATDNTTKHEQHEDEIDSLFTRMRQLIADQASYEKESLRLREEALAVRAEKKDLKKKNANNDNNQKNKTHQQQHVDNAAENAALLEQHEARQQQYKADKKKHRAEKGRIIRERRRLINAYESALTAALYKCSSEGAIHSAFFAAIPVAAAHATQRHLAIPQTALNSFKQQSQPQQQKAPQQAKENGKNDSGHNVLSSSSSPPSAASSSSPIVVWEREEDKVRRVQSDIVETNNALQATQVLVAAWDLLSLHTTTTNASDLLIRKEVAEAAQRDHDAAKHAEEEADRKRANTKEEKKKKNAEAATVSAAEPKRNNEKGFLAYTPPLSSAASALLPLSKPTSLITPYIVIPRQAFNWRGAKFTIKGMLLLRTYTVAQWHHRQDVAHRLLMSLFPHHNNSSGGDNQNNNATAKNNNLQLLNSTNFNGVAHPPVMALPSAAVPMAANNNNTGSSPRRFYESFLSSNSPSATIPLKTSNGNYKNTCSAAAGGANGVVAAGSMPLLGSFVLHHQPHFGGGNGGGSRGGGRRNTTSNALAAAGQNNTTAVSSQQQMRQQQQQRQRSRSAMNAPSSVTRNNDSTNNNNAANNNNTLNAVFSSGAAGGYHPTTLKAQQLPLVAADNDNAQTDAPPQSSSSLSPLTFQRRNTANTTPPQNTPPTSNSVTTLFTANSASGGAGGGGGVGVVGGPLSLDTIGSGGGSGGPATFHSSFHMSVSARDVGHGNTSTIINNNSALATVTPRKTTVPSAAALTSANTNAGDNRAFTALTTASSSPHPSSPAKIATVMTATSPTKTVSAVGTTASTPTTVISISGGGTSHQLTNIFDRRRTSSFSGGGGSLLSQQQLQTTSATSGDFTPMRRRRSSGNEAQAGVTAADEYTYEYRQSTTQGGVEGKRQALGTSDARGNNDDMSRFRAFPGSATASSITAATNNTAAANTLSLLSPATPPPPPSSTVSNGGGAAVAAASISFQGGQRVSIKPQQQHSSPNSNATLNSQNGANSPRLTTTTIAAQQRKAN